MAILKGLSADVNGSSPQLLAVERVVAAVDMGESAWCWRRDEG